MFMNAEVKTGKTLVVPEGAVVRWQKYRVAKYLHAADEVEKQRGGIISLRCLMAFNGKW